MIRWQTTGIHRHRDKSLEVLQARAHARILGPPRSGRLSFLYFFDESLSRFAERRVDSYGITQDRYGLGAVPGNKVCCRKRNPVLNIARILLNSHFPNGDNAVLAFCIEIDPQETIVVDNGGPEALRE